MIDRSKLGIHISKLRKLNGYTQRDIAKKLNISFQAVSKWERGLSLPDIDMISKICEVFNTSLTYFLFEVSSSMHLDELIDSVNEYGINESNYMSLGALIQSDIFNSSIIKRFTDDKVQITLRYMLLHTNEYIGFSLAKISHEICRKYADLIDLNILHFRREIINGVNVLFTNEILYYPYIIISKLLTRIVDNYNNIAIIFINEYKDKLYFLTRCSRELMDKGFNCSYITQLIVDSSIKPSVVAGASGGGKEGHSVLHINKYDLIDNYIDNSYNLFKEYVINFQNKFYISIVKR